MSAEMKAKIVRIKVEQGDAGLFYASSPELKGLLVAESTLEALQDSIPIAIREMYAVCGIEVFVTPVEDDDGDDLPPWVAVPADIARMALDNAGSLS